MSCLSWKWRKRSSVKITERTYEEGTEAFQSRRESSHPEAASCGQSASLGLVWRTGSSTNGVLPLAEGVLRERSRRFSISKRQVEEKQKRIEFLEKKVQTKDEVLAQLMAEHIALRKVLGNSNR